MLVWLSFASIHRPQGQTFIGAAVVEVPDGLTGEKAIMGAAIGAASDAGINPLDHECGQAKGVIVDPADIPPEFRGRLLSKQEIIANDLGEKA